MGKLEDLIKKAKNYDDVAMLEIVDKKLMLKVFMENCLLDTIV